MITNAEQHVRENGHGEWRSATRLHRCDKYFGDIASCRRAIRAGERYFNTQETVPDAGQNEPFRVCANCANTPHRADFLQGHTA